MRHVLRTFSHITFDKRFVFLVISIGGHHLSSQWRSFWTTPQVHQSYISHTVSMGVVFPNALSIVGRPLRDMTPPASVSLVRAPSWSRWRLHRPASLRYVYQIANNNWMNRGLSRSLKLVPERSWVFCCRKSHLIEQVTFGPRPSTALNAGVDQFALFLQSLSVGLSLREAAAELSLERLTRMTDIYRFCSVLTKLTKLTSFLFFSDTNTCCGRLWLSQKKEPWQKSLGFLLQARWSLGNLKQTQAAHSL